MLISPRTTGSGRGAVGTAAGKYTIRATFWFAVGEINIPDVLKVLPAGRLTSGLLAVCWINLSPLYKDSF